MILLKVLVTILSIIIFIKTIAYGFYEIKKRSNKSGGITVIVIAIATFTFSNLVVFIKGIN